MFSSSMIFRIFYINGRKLTITLDCHWLKNIVDYSQALQKSFQPYNLLY